MGHSLFILLPGGRFPMFAGHSPWFSTATGRYMHDALGNLHFWPSLIFVNGALFPRFLHGFAGVQRRLYDGGLQYAHAQRTLHLNDFMSWYAWLVVLSQVPFIINFIWRLMPGKKVEND